MSSQLPRHLHDLAKQIPENHEYSKLIYLPIEGLLFEKTDKRRRVPEQRRYQFLLDETEEVIPVKAYSRRDRKGHCILTATLKEGTNRVILGRDPDCGRKFFRVFRGYHHGFDDTYKIEKVLEDPGPFEEVHQDDEDHTIAGGKQQVNETGSTPDEAEGQATNSSETQLSRSPRSTRLRQTQGGPSSSFAVDKSNADAFRAPERSSRSMSPPEAHARVSSVELRSEEESRKALLSLFTQPSQRTVKFEDDDDIKMLDAAPVAPPRTASHAAIGPSLLHNLHVRFHPSGPKLAILTRRWFVCNTLRKLFSQALVAQILSRDESMSGLLVEVKSGGEGAVEAFAIAEGDVDTFDNLHFALNKAVRDWGLKGTTVEVSRI